MRAGMRGRWWGLWQQLLQHCLVEPCGARQGCHSCQPA
jgi:hypothetical protein